MTDNYIEIGHLKARVGYLESEVKRIHLYHKRKFWITIGILIGALGIQRYTGGLF